MAKIKWTTMNKLAFEEKIKIGFCLGLCLIAIILVVLFAVKLG